MKRTWWEKLYDSVADRGRELIHLHGDAPHDSIGSLCDALLHGTGEAAGTALAREVVRTLHQMDAAGWTAFLERLATEYAPDPERLRATIDDYCAAPGDLDAYLALAAAIEPPRQELLRRINLAPRGTAILVELRRHLLTLLREHPQLRGVDADFRHLFYSWFNRGFLELRRIDWSSSAQVLEKLIGYEAVHAIQGWGDLRRRLANDRRCFAFFHPALRDDPLIFVEVALVVGIPEAAGPLLDLDSPVIDPAEADTAAFFSINNCQDGLRGISFGNFLIKQVVAELQAEFPGIRDYVTFSPVPSFAAALHGLDAPGSPLDRTRAAALLDEFGAALGEAAGTDDPVDALLTLLDDASAHRALLAAPLQRLALAWLARARRAHGASDPVAAFHLANGAQLERINPFSDDSDERMLSSFGLMVNYRYDPATVERNHEQYVAEGFITVSKGLARELKRVDAAWGES